MAELDSVTFSQLYSFFWTPFSAKSYICFRKRVARCIKHPTFTQVLGNDNLKSYICFISQKDRKESSSLANGKRERWGYSLLDLFVFYTDSVSWMTLEYVTCLTYVDMLFTFFFFVLGAFYIKSTNKLLLILLPKSFYLNLNHFSPFMGSIVSCWLRLIGFHYL